MVDKGQFPAGPVTQPAGLTGSRAIPRDGPLSFLESEWAGGGETSKHCCPFRQKGEGGKLSCLRLKAVLTPE